MVLPWAWGFWGMHWVVEEAGGNELAYNFLLREEVGRTHCNYYILYACTLGNLLILCTLVATFSCLCTLDTFLPIYTWWNVHSHWSLFCVQFWFHTDDWLIVIVETEPGGSHTDTLQLSPIPKYPTAEPCSHSAVFFPFWDVGFIKLSWLSLNSLCDPSLELVSSLSPE